MKYGYARVSTDGRSVDAQVRQLTKAGCRRVFRETASGAKTDRAQLRRVIAVLEPGDVLTVTRLDRLARSTRDQLNTLAGRLMLTVLGGLAQFERELIRARTSEGRARAKANGKSLGRPHKLAPHQRREAIRRRDSGDETVREIARSFNVHHATISRLRDQAAA
jgi:DNA invertase Pin-like site-specific DNA recombinase